MNAVMWSAVFLLLAHFRTAGPSPPIPSAALPISGANCGRMIMNALKKSIRVLPAALTVSAPNVATKSRNRAAASDLTSALNLSPRSLMTGAILSMMGFSMPIRPVIDLSHGWSAPATTGVSAAFTLSHASAMPPSCLDRAIWAGDMPAYAVAMASCSALNALALGTPWLMAVL